MNRRRRLGQTAGALARFSVTALIVFLGSGGAAITARAERAAELTPALAARLAEVRKSAPPDFTVLAQPPFIVAGDEAPEVVRQRAAQTVQRTVDRLKQDFFARDPEEVIVIWLFKDKASYEHGIWTMFGDANISPYGYYSARHHALLMNIATGSGTLVHEIVHPFIRTNFPGCPPWFNEGLASLFEQCTERDDHLTGLPNWRLPGLQKLIRDKQTIPFAELFALSDTAFYGATEGYNRHYGQARYLCYYLQEHDLLIPFYREFSKHASEDPTGLRSLRKILRTDDLEKFQRQWEQAMLRLKYPSTAPGPAGP